MELISPFGELIGAKILSLDTERGSIEVAYQATEQFTNPIGTVAGAMIAGLLDSTTGLVANAGLADGRVAVHKSLSIDYHRPLTPGRVTGRGHIVERDEREIRSAGELFDAEGQRVASASAILRIIAWSAD